MDALSRCNVELHNAGKLRERVADLGARVAAGPRNQRVAAMHAQLVALDRTLARRIDSLTMRAAEFEISETGSEELELDAGLVAHLEVKMRLLCELLQRELDPKRQVAAPAYEEPPG